MTKPEKWWTVVHVVRSDTNGSTEYRLFRNQEATRDRSDTFYTVIDLQDAIRDDVWPRVSLRWRTVKTAYDKCAVLWLYHGRKELYPFMSGDDENGEYTLVGRFKPDEAKRVVLDYARMLS